MTQSRAWKWEIVDKDDNFWNSPAPEVFYLCERWSQKGFKSFLDIGCGYGRNSIYFMQHDFEVSAFDLSEYGVDVAIKKAKEHKLCFKNICVADMHNMPYENDCFDCMLALNVISHTDKPGFDKVLKEIKRVLKPGGEVYFTLGSKESYWYNNPVCKYVDEYTKIRVEDGPENGIPHFYISDEDCKTLFNDFEIVEIKNVRELTQYGNFSPHYHVWLKKQD